MSHDIRALAPRTGSCRRRIGLSIALGVLLGVFHSAHAHAAEPYRLQSQDRVRVHVSDWPSLTGDVTLDPSGRVTLPVVGEVEAADTTTAELAERISQTLRDTAGLPDLPDTVVVVEAYRPFYILGDVAAPGEYAYRPGMLALNALSLAGGVYRRQGGMDWPIDQAAIEARSEAEALSTRASDLRAERARLDAEMTNAPSFESQTEAEADSRAFRQQLPLFQARREAAEARRAALRGTVAASERTRDAILAQGQSIAARLAAAEEDLGRIRPLADRSLALDRLSELNRAVTQAQTEQQSSELALLRAEQELLAARDALAAFEFDRRDAILTEIRRNETETRDVEARRQGVEETLRFALLYAAEATARDTQTGEQRLSFSIVRLDEAGTPEEIEAGETTRIRPGDIVKVTRMATPASSPARERPER